MRARSWRTLASYLGGLTALSAVVAIGAFITNRQGCFIGARPPDPEPPWYTVYLERPLFVIVPAIVFFVVAFGALGAGRVVVRIAGLALATAAAYGAFVVLSVGVPSCT